MNNKGGISDPQGTTLQPYEIDRGRVINFKISSATRPKIVPVPLCSLLFFKYNCDNETSECLIFTLDINSSVIMWPQNESVLYNKIMHIMVVVEIGPRKGTVLSATIFTNTQFKMYFLLTIFYELLQDMKQNILGLTEIHWKIQRNLSDIFYSNHNYILATIISLGYLCNIRVEPTTNCNSNETYVILFQI